MASKFNKFTINGYKVPTAVSGVQMALMCRAIISKPGLTRKEALKVFCGISIYPNLGMQREDQRVRFTSLCLSPGTATWAVGPETDAKSPSGKLFRRVQETPRSALRLYPINDVTSVVAAQYEDRVEEMVVKNTLGPALTPVGSMVDVHLVHGGMGVVTPAKGLVIKQGWRAKRPSSKSYYPRSDEVDIVESLWGLVDGTPVWFETIIRDL